MAKQVIATIVMIAIAVAIVLMSGFKTFILYEVGITAMGFYMMVDLEKEVDDDGLADVQSGGEKQVQSDKDDH